MRKDPIYLTTHTGRPPDEPSVLGEALNEVFVPLLRAQFPEIVDFWLPPEGCSYRIAVVSMKKAYPGHAKRVMMGVWSYLRQFMYTKWVIVVDDDIDARDWKDVMWAISTPVSYTHLAIKAHALVGQERMEKAKMCIRDRVRPLQADCPRPRPDLQRAGRQGHRRQGQHRRQSGDPVTLRRARHSDHDAVQGRPHGLDEGRRHAQAEDPRLAERSGG